MNTNKINREEILEKIDSLKNDNKRVCDKAKEHITKVLNTFIVENGFEDICEINNLDDKNFEIGIKKNGEIVRNIEITFYKSVGDEFRKLSINFLTFGSFFVEEKDKRNYLIVLGKLTENMNEIESHLLDFNWNEYDEIHTRFHNACSELQHFDQSVKLRELEEKKGEILGSLKIGTKIIMGERCEYGQYDKNGNVIKVPDIRTIERIGNKTLNISGVCKRTNVNDFVFMITNKIWKLV